MRSRLINILFIGLSIGSEAIYIHEGSANFIAALYTCCYCHRLHCLGGYLDNDHYDHVIDRANGKEGIIVE